MSFITDLRAVSESVMDQLADRFSDLPRPMLAAIGAGDMAAERFAELRESMMDSIPGPGSLDRADVRALAADLPARAQKAAADVAGSLEQFAAQAPAKTQGLITELPARVSEIAQALSPETVRETVEAYTHLAGVIYGNLAKRGGQTWTKMRSSGLLPGTVVEPAMARAAHPEPDPAAPRNAARATAPGPAASTKPTPPRAAAAAKPTPARPAAAAKPTPARPAAVKRTATNPAATNPATAKPKPGARRPPAPRTSTANGVADPSPAG